VPPVELWAWAFAWTIALEVPIVAAFTHGRLGGLARAVAVGIGLQILTHPALWYVAPRFEPYALWLVVMESIVTAVEAATLAGALRLAGRPWREAALVGTGAAFVANLTSTLAGFVLI
jgi:hypothetical protein